MQTVVLICQSSIWLNNDPRQQDVERHIDAVEMLRGWREGRCQILKWLLMLKNVLELASDNDHPVELGIVILFVLIIYSSLSISYNIVQAKLLV